MPLDTGRRLGPYEIVSPIGAGGMGEVYEARDTRLGRTVAVKVLPESLAEHPERRARFEREARAVSQLTHPHVCTLHDVGEEEGIHFLVLEHCEGETLARRLERGPLSLEETLRYGAQIAGALDAAHRKGVIHRDLKPANVMLTASGVKLLDFGLAHLAAGDPRTMGDLPTMTLDAGRPLTEEGAVLGTFPYMAPEQVEGGETDARSDLFALGAVLYEMATGRRAFEGKSAASVMAAVLREDPEPLSSVRPVAPPALDHVVSRCLAKDPEERWQSARDVAVELRWIAEAGSQTGVAAPVAKRRRSRERLAWALFALAAMAAGTLAVLGLPGEPEVASGPVRFSILPPEEVVFVWNPTISQDGSFVVYKGWTRDGANRLYLRELGRLGSEPLPGTERTETHFVSPDGRWIGLRRDDGLYKVARAGGDVLTVLEEGANGPGATWGEDGTIVYSTSWLGGLAEVPDEGGEPRTLTEPDAEREEIGHWWPQILPNGRDVLFTIFRAAAGVNEARIAALDRGSGEVRTLLPGAQGVFVPPDRIVFYRAGTYHAVAFDAEALTLRGSPVRVEDDWRELIPAGSDEHGLSVSATGTLAFVPGRLIVPSSLVWVARDGSSEPLPVPPRSWYADLRISSTGRWAAGAAFERGRSLLVLVDLERGIDEVLDFAGNVAEPAWHPDGRRLAWESMQRGNFDVYWKDIEAGGSEEALLVTGSDEWPEVFTRDGRRLVISRSQPDGAHELALLDLTGEGEPRSLPTVGEECTLSRGDRWIACEDKGAVFVEPFLREGPTVRVSPGAGENPIWGVGEDVLLYERGSQIVSVPYREEGSRFAMGEERVVADVPGLWGFEVAPDGRILALAFVGPEAPQPEIRVVLGWGRELRQAAEGAGAR